MNCLQNVGEHGYDSLGCLLHSLPLCSSKITCQAGSSSLCCCCALGRKTSADHQRSCCFA